MAIRMSRAAQARQRVARWTAEIAAHVEPRELGSKLIRGARTKTALVVGCLALLAAGWLTAPSAPHREPAAEKVAPIIEAEVARTEPLRAFRGVQEVARLTRPSVVVFPGERSAEARTHPFRDFLGPAAAPPRRDGVGVLVSKEGEVLTHVAALPGTGDAFVATLASGQSTHARVVAFESRTDLALLRLEDVAESETAVLAVTGIESGDLGVALFRRSGRDAMGLTFFSSSSTPDGAIGALSDAPPPGTPLFSLSGELLAVVGTHASATIPVHGARDALERLRQRVADGHPFPATLGLVLQPTAGALRARVGEGALVSEVLPGGPAAEAGILPGDVVVRIGDSAIPGSVAASALVESLPAGVETSLLVRRARDEVEATVRPVAVVPDAGRPSDPRSAPEVGLAAADLFPPEVVTAAGLAPEARVLEIEGRAVASRPVTRRRLRRLPPPWLVRLQTGDDRFYALVGEPR